MFHESTRSVGEFFPAQSTAYVMAQENRGDITIIDSVHISPDHFELIRDKVAQENPDIVAIELCENRFQAMLSDKDVSIRDLIREQPLWKVTIHALLKFAQSQLLRRYGVHPEMSDMRAGVEAAAKNDSDIALIDRDISETFQSLSTNIQDPAQLGTMAYGIVTQDEEDIPKSVRETSMTDFDALTEPEFLEDFTEFAKESYPPIWKAFLDERDQIMARNLHSLSQNGHDVIAVVGAAHGPGIRRYLAELSPEEMPELPPIHSVSLSEN